MNHNLHQVEHGVPCVHVLAQTGLSMWHLEPFYSQHVHREHLSALIESMFPTHLITALLSVEHPQLSVAISKWFPAKWLFKIKQCSLSTDSRQDSPLSDTQSKQIMHWSRGLYEICLVDDYWNCSVKWQFLKWGDSPVEPSDGVTHF